MTSQISTLPARRVARLALRWLVRLVMIAVLTVIIAAVTVLMIMPRATSSTALTVLTGSMTPGIPVGSVVMVRPVDTHQLKVGDIATYQAEPGKDTYITHRIMKINHAKDPATFIFKGDANRGRDMKPVPAGAIRGEVWFHVPYLGAIRDALHGKAGLSLLAMLVLGGYAISQLVEVVRDKRKPVAAVEVEPVRIAVDRALLLAEIPTASVFGTPPSDAAKDWGGVLLRQEESTFTVLLAPEPWDLSALIKDLQVFDPVCIRVLETPTPITIQLDEEHAKVWESVPVGPNGDEHHAA